MRLGTSHQGINSLTDGRINLAMMKAWVEGNTLVGDLNGFDAARYCDVLSVNGKTDWYLPARNELSILWENRTAIGGFVPTMYWSSSEVQRNNPWGVAFSNGDGKYPGKNDTLTRTHCIRTLTPPPAAPSEKTTRLLVATSMLEMVASCCRPTPTL